MVLNIAGQNIVWLSVLASALSALPRDRRADTVLDPISPVGWLADNVSDASMKLCSQLALIVSRAQMWLQGIAGESCSASDSFRKLIPSESPSYHSDPATGTR